MSAPCDEQQVLAYLQDHPDFLLRHPQLVAHLTPPPRWPTAVEADGGSAQMVDFNVYMIERLRGDLDMVREAVDHLIGVSKDNLTTQIRTHQAILALLGAREIPDLLAVMARDLPLMLGVDCAVIAAEPGSLPLDATDTAGLAHLEVGRSEALLEGAPRYRLLDVAPPYSDVFGPQAETLSSAAFIRLKPGDGIPNGVLALGAQAAGTFHPSQGTELLTFLARIIELCLKRLMA